MLRVTFWTRYQVLSLYIASHYIWLRLYTKLKIDVLIILRLIVKNITYLILSVNVLENTKKIITTPACRYVGNVAALRCQNYKNVLERFFVLLVREGTIVIAWVLILSHGEKSPIRGIEWDECTKGELWFVWKPILLNIVQTPVSSAVYNFIFSIKIAVYIPDDTCGGKCYIITILLIIPYRIYFTSLIEDLQTGQKGWWSRHLFRHHWQNEWPHGHVTGS
jgi:hypothetical protein